MSPAAVATVRHWNLALHRDFGYFLTSLVIAYCLSGLALNHIDAWNPDFVIDKRTVQLPRTYTAAEVTPEMVAAFGTLIDETAYRVYDSPAPGHLKVYYDNATLHLRLDERIGTYERIVRRPLFYDANVLHRNSLKPWRWFADGFAVLLVLVNVTGLFVLRGKQGLTGRGKWLIAAGALPPVLAVAWFRML